jgi:hypothetical protein
MSSSEMSFQTQLPPFRTHLGKALRLQVVSALLLIGSLLSLSDIIPLISMEWVIVLGVLYAVGFLQLIILRTLLQKVKYSVYAAAGVSLVAAVLTGLTWMSLFTVISPEWRSLPLIASTVINIVLYYSLLEVHRKGGIKSAFLPEDQDSSP